MAHDELCPVAPPHEILLPYAVPGLLQGGEGRLYQGSALSRDLRTERQAGPLYPEGSLYLPLAHQGVLLFHVFNGLFLIRREHGHRRGSHVLLIMRFEPGMAGRALYTDLPSGTISHLHHFPTKNLITLMHSPAHLMNRTTMTALSRRK